MIFSIVAPAGAVAIRPATSPTAQKITRVRRIFSPPNMECRFCIAANHVIAI
jgi:hypothetical protein